MSKVMQRNAPDARGLHTVIRDMKFMRPDVQGYRTEILTVCRLRRPGSFACSGVTTAQSWSASN